HRCAPLLHSGSSKSRARATAARPECARQACIGSRIVLPGTLHAEMETARTITSRSRRSKRQKPLQGERGAAPIRATSSGRRRARKLQNATLTFRAISPSENEDETRNPRPHISRVQAHPRKTRVLSKVSGGGRVIRVN